MTAVTEFLILDDVSRRFPTPGGGELTVLDGVSLQVSAGQTVAVLGPSGSGKTTLLNILGGLDRPTCGRILVGGVNVGELDGRELARYRSERVGFVFQEHHLLPQLTALENVLLPSLALGSCAAAESRARELLDAVGLADRSDHIPARLSGGERQRVALARALINGADLLLCDEPTGNLDRQTGQVVLSLLLQMAAEHGATVIMVTHNSEHAVRMERCLELRDGKLISCSPELPDTAT